MEFNGKQDRRREGRSPGAGAIEISFEDPNPVTIKAELVEISSRGFRARHDSKALAPALEVHYMRKEFSGRARVIWTHVLEGRCVSGFLIVSVE
jgi:hypothetical protein